MTEPTPDNAAESVDPLTEPFCCQDSEDGGWGDEDQEMLAELDALTFGEPQP